ncbi:hypothetical protein [Sphingobium tyrosinilyticum]|uniref:Uncharacterized protein n=1 Tax=Sphingobium tyrosinilyticum TaxID=2715436 RepID=A0ABV9EYM1_9SPHN
MLTAAFEDSAAMAAEGQAGAPLPSQFERAQALEAAIRDAHTIVESIAHLSAGGSVFRGAHPTLPRT